MKKRFKVGDLVFAHEKHLGIVVEVCDDKWYHYYKIDDSGIIFNDYNYKHSKFKGIHFSFDEDFKLIERENTLIHVPHNKRGKEMKLKESSIKLVKAWESLEGGKDYSPEDIGRWLHNKMKPAIDNLRKVLNLNTPKPPKTD